MTALLILLLLLSCCHGDEFDEGIPEPVESEVEIQYGYNNDTFDYIPATQGTRDDVMESRHDVIEPHHDLIATDHGITDDVETDDVTEDSENDASWRDWSRGSHGNGGVWSRDQQRNRGHPGIRVITVTTRLEAPYMMLRKDSPFLTGNDRFEGHLADMLARLSRLLVFDYVILLARDGKMGGPGENASYTGILGEVLRKEADIGVGPLTINHRWRNLVQFTEPFLSFRSSALIRKEKRQPRLQTAEELLYSGMKYGILQGSITQRLFASSTNATYRQMWSRMATFWPPALVQSQQEGIERSRRENFAFILDSPTAEYLANRKPCEFYTLEPFLPPREYAFIMHKDNEFIGTINEGLQQLYEMEEMQLLYLKWWMGECPILNSGTKPRSRHVHRDHKVRQRPKNVTKKPRQQPTASYFSRSNSLNFSFIVMLFSILLSNTM